MTDGRQDRRGLQSDVYGLLSALAVFWSLGGSVLGGVAYAQPTPVAGLTPEETVTRYLEALKAGNLAAAYDYMSAGMAQHKSRADWTKEQQWSLQMSDVKIFEFHVYPGKIDGNTAHVPDLLSSQDKFLNQLGLPEHELYILIREDGRWKIDQQQLLERSEQGKWFPAPPPDGK